MDNENGRQQTADSRQADAGPDHHAATMQTDRLPSTVSRLPTKDNQTNQPTPGQIAYDAYCAALGSCALPLWDELGAKVRAAWEAGGRAVVADVSRKQEVLWRQSKLVKSKGSPSNAGI